MRWFFLVLLLSIGCNEPTKHPENITGTTHVIHSLEGEVIDHHTKEVIPAKTPRYILVYARKGRVVNGHYYKSIESICNVYCN